MTANVVSVGAVSDPNFGSAGPSQSSNPAAAASTETPAIPNPADYRLVIEDDEKAGCFVYKTIDRRTGEVVQQLPREQLIKLREAPDYAAGAVISTRA
jgi:flagellar protein FlaG